VWRAKRTIQAIDNAAKEEVGKAVEEAKSSPEPRVEDLWSDIYYKGTEPPSMRGREREEVSEAVFSSDQPRLSVLYRFTFFKG
jgi:pyruvate dehydrogenase E1 component alpha subunit